MSGDLVLPLLAVVMATVLPAHAFTAAQAEAGARIYKRQCVRCHGVNGEGKDNAYKGLRAPALIGAHVLPCMPRPTQKLRTHPFRTAQDIYAFISALMPADQPAILDADEYWDVIAYLLHANNRVVNEERLDAATAGQVVIHADCATSGPHVAGERHP